MTKANKNPIRISNEAWDRLKDEQNARRKLTGVEPSFAELIDECLFCVPFSEQTHIQKGTSGNPDIVLSSASRSNANSPRPSTSTSGDFEPWVSYLLHILESGNVYAVPSIQKNLEAFARLTDLDEGRNDSPPDNPQEEARRILAEAKADIESAAAAATAHHRKGSPGRRKTA